MENWEKEISVKEQTISFFVRGMKVMWELFGQEKRILIFTIIWIAVLQFITLLFNLLLKHLFDEIPGLLEIKKFSNYVIILLVLILVVKFAQIVLNRFFIEIRFLKMMIRLENAWPALAHKKLLKLSLAFHEKENTGKKIDKISKGCDRMVDILCRLRWGFAPQLFYILINLTIILFMDVRLGLLFMFPFPIAAYFYLQAFQKVAPIYKEWEVKKEKSAGLFCQSVINIQTVQNYVQEVRECESFACVRHDMEIMDTKASVRMQYYFFAALTILWLFFIATIALSIYFVIDGSSTIGTVVYIISTGTVTLEGIWQLVHEYTEILKRLISVFRLKDLLDEESDVGDEADAMVPDVYKGTIELDNLSFKYPKKEKAVLDKFSLEINKGEMIAFVGKSGEGKTTAVKLICRMFDVSKGSIKLDGIDIRNIRLSWYRKLFAIVQQDVEIFDASISNNIRYSSPNASKTQVEEAMKAAHLDVVVNDRNRFPNGLHEQVGEKGVKLSGGERQRVGIARAYLALLNGAKVLILDEATSSLDSQAELAIQQMIERLRKKQAITIIAIAHRLSTIQKADNIYVINDGNIVERGSHSGLVKRNGIYSKLAALQQIGALRE